MAKQLEEVILTVGPDELGAVIVEPMTAGGGILVPPAGYYETIREICDKYELLLIIDEVVYGLWPYRQVVRLPALQRPARHRHDG